MSRIEAITSGLVPLAHERQPRQRRATRRSEGAGERESASTTVTINFNNDRYTSNHVDVVHHSRPRELSGYEAGHQQVARTARRLAALPPPLQMYEVVSMMGDSDGLADRGRNVDGFL